MGDMLGEIDLVNPDNYVERVPFEWFDHLRAEHPVVWHPEPDGNAGFWAVTRYDDLTNVHMNWETFSSELGAVSLEELDAEQLEVRKSMLETDPPRHTELRKICSKRFSARGVGKYEDWIREVAAGVLDRALPMGEFDFVSEISRELPDPVPLLDLHGAAGGRARADHVGRQHDREPGPRPLGRRGRPGRHRGLPAAAVPLPHRAGGLRVRRPPARPSARRTRRRRAPGPHDRAVRRGPRRARVPQLLRGADDRGERDHAAHDQPRDARADRAPGAARAPARAARADPERDRGAPALGDPGDALPPDGDARHRAARTGDRRRRQGRHLVHRARTSTTRCSPTPTRST